MAAETRAIIAISVAALALGLVSAAACGTSSGANATPSARAGAPSTAPNLTPGATASAQASPPGRAGTGTGAAEPDGDNSDVGPRVSAGELPNGVSVQHDIAYGSDPAQVMDVYRPADATNAPVLLMVHGGGWRRGDKAAEGVVLNKVKHFVPEGYIFISINYRLAPKATPPEQAGDVAQALAFAQQRAASWGGDAARFILMGHSAGANLVALVASQPDLITGHNVQPWLGTIVLDSAAYNVVTIMQSPHLSLYDPIFGKDQALWEASSPTLQLKAAPATPMLLVCSTNRTDSCPAARDYATRASGFGGKTTLLPEPLRHGDINKQLGASGMYTNSVDGFLRALGLP